MLYDTLNYHNFTQSKFNKTLFSLNEANLIKLTRTCEDSRVWLIFVFMELRGECSENYPLYTSHAFRIILGRRKLFSLIISRNRGKSFLSLKRAKVEGNSKSRSNWICFTQKLFFSFLLALLEAIYHRE